MDFLNKNQKVYIGEEEKKVFLEKLKRDVEVRGCLSSQGALPSVHGMRWISPLFFWEGGSKWKVRKEPGETPRPINGQGVGGLGALGSRT